jgi:hypothetical protein
MAKKKRSRGPRAPVERAAPVGRGPDRFARRLGGGVALALGIALLVHGASSGGGGASVLGWPALFVGLVVFASAIEDARTQGRAYLALAVAAVVPVLWLAASPRGDSGGLEALRGPVLIAVAIPCGGAALWLGVLSAGAYRRAAGGR